MDRLREKVVGMEEEYKKDKEKAIEEIKEFYEKQIFELWKQIQEQKDKNGSLVKAQKRVVKLAKQKEAQAQEHQDDGTRKMRTGVSSPDARPYEDKGQKASTTIQQNASIQVPVRAGGRLLTKDPGMAGAWAALKIPIKPQARELISSDYEARMRTGQKKAPTFLTDRAGSAAHH